MDISTVLKIAGILVAGTLGVLGIVTGTRDEQTKLLTYWGRCVLCLTIAGAVLALGAQIVDSLSQSRRDHDILMGLQDQSTKAAKILNQDNDILSGVRDQSTATANVLRQDGDILASTHKQSEIASRSLHSIQDLLSQVDEIHIEAELELPQTDPRIAELVEEFHRLANSDTAFVGNCHGFNLRSRNATIICEPFDPDQQPVFKALPVIGALTRVWQILPLMTGRVWVNKTKEPLAALRDGNEAKSDLFMFNCDVDSKNQGGLIYYESVRKVYLRPTRFFSTSKVSDCWFTKDTAIGIHALADAQISVEFNWRKASGSSELDPLVYRIHPDFISLETGKTALFLRGLTTSIQRPEGPYAANFALSLYSQAQLPNETGIMARRLALPPSRMTGIVVVH